MKDIDIDILRVLASTSESIFLNKKSNIARINSLEILQEEKDKLIENTIKPLDDGIKYLQKDIYNILIRIPIYNYFLANQPGVNIFDSAQLISIIIDINNFKNFNNLVSYAGFTPYSKNYNKKLHKLLLKIGYKIVLQNPKYEFIYEMALDKYRKKKPHYSEEHIKNMAKRIVIKKFLKNLYVNWKAVDRNFE